MEFTSHRTGASTADNPTKREYEDSFRFEAHDGRGSNHVDTTARLYEGMKKLPPGFKIQAPKLGAPNPAGGLPSTGDDPKLPIKYATPPVDRHWEIEI